MPLLLPLLAPLLLLAAASLAAHAAPIPALPSWAKGPNYRGDDAWKPYSVEQGLRNRQNMLEANQDSRPFDFILYGDR